jgi:hypothetical protein
MLFRKHIFPPTVGKQHLSYRRDGYVEPVLVVHDQIDADAVPNLLNETAFLYSGNTIHLTPVGVSAKPTGWTGTTFFPDANNRGNRMPKIQLGGPYSTTWSSSYFPCWATKSETICPGTKDGIN